MTKKPLADSELLAMYDKIKLRKSMIFHKKFLLELFETNSLTAKKVLMSATDVQLRQGKIENIRYGSIKHLFDSARLSFQR